jgi:hypothetical protein
MFLSLRTYVEGLAQTPAGGRVVQAAGTVDRRAREGCVVFHVGSVEEVRQEGSILTIEGNADPPRRTRRRQVMRKLRVGIVLTASEVSRPPADHPPAARAGTSARGGLTGL